MGLPLTEMRRICRGVGDGCGRKRKSGERKVESWRCPQAAKNPPIMPALCRCTKKQDIDNTFSKVGSTVGLDQIFLEAQHGTSWLALHSTLLE